MVPQRPPHSHKCPRCEHIWEHDTRNLKSEAEYEAAHLCPKCGTEQRYIHDWIGEPPPSPIEAILMMLLAQR